MQTDKQTDRWTDICDCRVAFATEKHNLIVFIEIMIHILLKLNENNLFEAATFSRRISSTMKQVGLHFSQAQTERKKMLYDIKQ